jgi:prevent-host-death family protein
MKEIGAYQAKTHLAELLDEVLAGETITISRHGTPVAVMMPVPSQQKASPQDVIAKLRRLRERARLDGLSLQDLIEEGRK